MAEHIFSWGTFCLQFGWKKVSASWGIWIRVLGGPTPIFYWISSLMVEVHGRGGWVGASPLSLSILPLFVWTWWVGASSLSPSFHSLFGRVEIHSSFLATYALTCTQTRPFPSWSDLFLLAPIFQTTLLDNLYHISMAASTRLLDNLYHISMAASTRLLHNVHYSNMAASTRLLDDRVIYEVTQSSPCLWASFHPPIPSFSGIHKVKRFD